jgi:hypothetical protein
MPTEVKSAVRTRKMLGGLGRTPRQETRQDGALQTLVLQMHAGACAGGCTCRRAVSFAVGHGSARKRADTKTGVTGAGATETGATEVDATETDTAVEVCTSITILLQQPMRSSSEKRTSRRSPGHVLSRLRSSTGTRAERGSGLMLSDSFIVPLHEQLRREMTRSF